jgi:hydroxymethylbilane synthase
MAVATPKLRIGTRASPLALAQAHLVRASLCAAHDWEQDEVLICAMTATGDRILDRPLADVGGKELWTRELDRALLAGDIDIAVHSMKDVETIRPAAIALAAMLPRADVRDRLIGANSVAELPVNARVGTSSPRRKAQLLSIRPDLEIVLFRGNVGTRLAKIEGGEADATLLAAAGLDRLGMADIGASIPIDVMLPAPSQGAIGIEVRTNDDQSREITSLINHADTFACVSAERAFLGTLAGDCRTPIAAYAAFSGDEIVIQGEILTPDGSERHAASLTANAANALAAGKELAEILVRDASPQLRALFGR